MQEVTPILEFKDVTFRAALSDCCGVNCVNLTVCRGELVLIKLEEGREHNSLAPLAQGVVSPECGQVLFEGEDWTNMPPGRLSFLRGRIRRVFQHYGWITNLDIMENICLAELHHTRRAAADIEAEARALARRFGIDPIPTGRPTRGHSAVLRRLEWVRAFLGQPDLILLERPCAGAPKADAPKVVRAALDAASRGSAVLWLEDDHRILDYQEFAAARRLRMEGETVRAA